MVYTVLTRKAMEIAYRAHHGQVDKCGTPYIFHPIHLAEQMEDEISCCVALLHDVAEDTNVTLEDLAREFPESVMDALALLTHDAGTDYFEYVRAIRSNPIAREVKLADLAHNSDPNRRALTGLDEKRLAVWCQKYQKAREILVK